MTNCKYIDEYIYMVRNSIPKPYCKKQHQLCDFIEKVFAAEEIYVDMDATEKYFELQKYFPYKLLPWEKFIFVLHITTYTKDGYLRFPYLFCNLGRGAGKNGLLSFICFCLLTPINRVQKYDIYIYATSEDQAKTSWDDVHQILEDNERKMRKFFYWTKEKIQNKITKSKFFFCTSSAKTKDGQRPALVAFDEYHAYQDMKLVNVAQTGLGKKKDARKTIVTTNGNIRGGPFDTLLENAINTLNGDEPDDGWLYFVCTIDDPDEIDDEVAWFKANPSLYEDMDTYYDMMREMRLEYKEYKRNPAEHIEFPTKRMNCPPVVMENEVTPWETVLATNQPIDEEAINGMPCVLGIDYMKTTDFLSAGLLWKVREKYYWVQKTWVCKHSADLNKIKAPLDAWAIKGDIEFVDCDEIPPDLPVVWAATEAAKRGSMILMAGLDEYRFLIMKQALLSYNFSPDKGWENVKKIRPSDEMRRIPVITSGFVNKIFCWGDVPVLRWAVQNSKLAANSHGNFTYEKIEPKSRKTDPFKAFVAAMCVSDCLEDYAYQKDMPDMGSFAI